jgi:hypothetical protein
VIEERRALLQRVLWSRFLEKAGRIDEAKRMLVDGISAARRTGNAHAQSEMTAMLEGL